jgi:hypothetical protein
MCGAKERRGFSIVQKKLLSKMKKRIYGRIGGWNVGIVTSNKSI